MTIPFTNPLHLYRALLREISYVFDRNARNWTHGHLKSSFRSGIAKIQDGNGWKTLPYDPNRTSSLNERHQLKRGRKFLVLVQKANQGYPRQLRGLLQLAYGRKGRRKRSLIAPLMQPGFQNVHNPSEATEGNLAAQQGLKTSIPDKFTKEWRASEDFLSLLQTQNQLSSHLDTRLTIRLKPHIEEKNKWGRPMPPSRIKNTTKKWYAKMAAAMLPPVSEPEWNELKAKVIHKEAFELVPRRPTARRTLEDSQEELTEKTASAILSGIAKPTSLRLVKRQNPHNMTPRFLRRFYAKHILNHTPLAVPNPKGKGLVSKWDDGKRDVLAPVKPKDDAQIEALFG